MTPTASDDEAWVCVCGKKLYDHPRVGIRFVCEENGSFEFAINDDDLDWDTIDADEHEEQAPAA